MSDDNPSKYSGETNIISFNFPDAKLRFLRTLPECSLHSQNCPNFGGLSPRQGHITQIIRNRIFTLRELNELGADDDGRKIDKLP